MMCNDVGAGGLAPQYCRVALVRPVFDTFQYRIPPSLSGAIRPGVRVVVPFGRQVLTGVVWSIEAEVDVARVRDVKEVLDKTPLLSEPLIGLCRWISRYYAAPPGIVVRAALPPGLLSDSGARQTPELRRKVIALTARLPTLLSRDEAFGRARRQRDVYEALEGMGGRAEVARLERLLAVSRSVIEALAEKGLAEIRDEVVRRDPFADVAIEEGSGRHEPSSAQAAVIEDLQVLLDSEGPGVALLRGVTGSGKTLVYLELLESALAAGRSAIVLVPEIALTPQTVGRFRARFGDLIAVLHSALSDGERYDEWTALREGDKCIAIGTRSAIFAPVDNLGLIVLDEEHDSSYKQSDTPRYHARAVATMRARAAGALCVLGSATPSLESWSNAVEGRYRLFELPERVTPHALPAVEIVDMRRERELRLERAAGADHGDPEPGPIILSERLRDAVERRLESGEQSILLLNRRGYSTFLQCEACGWVWSCRQCNVSLTFHRSRQRLVCHHCAFEMVVPTTCTECGEDALVFSGLGTEQVERRIGEMFPAARIARMDVDTTGTKWAHREILERVERREVDILLGTQMIAKGLDFPGVTLVGIINADVGLNLPDFRAAERTFQLLAQVAGRAGRGALPGQVLVQTSKPGHFAVRAALDHDFVGFAAQELEDRAEPGYPPHRGLANLVVSGDREDAVASEVDRLADHVRDLVRNGVVEGVDVVGPAPCPIDRVRGRWRWHFLLKSANPVAAGNVLRHLAEHHASAGRGLRLEIDRDPEALL
jgi:primosomal protein N' (replication factor Y)